jgi:uncharacterized membrane protein
VAKARVEAFSDGVIAIAITLLALEIDVPAPGGGSLGHALGRQWPSYVAYVVSFLTIGVIWINHHAMLRRLQAVDHTALVLNLVLLMSIGILPWTTSLLADYLRESDGQHLAAAIYAGSFLLMSVAFYALQHYVLYSPRRLLHERIDDAIRARVARRGRLGLIPYAIAVAVAPLSAYAALGICALLGVYYALPTTTVDE